VGRHHENGDRHGRYSLNLEQPDRNVRALFLNYARQRAEFAAELQGQVSRIGGEPATSGSTTGAMHRGWIGLKTALTGNDDHAILEEAERGEDSAVKAYREALARDLPSDIHSIIERQYKEVKQTHNSVRSLRDTARRAEMPMSGLI
jgi:uncharacterized protein (TIGR02284 family)